MKISFERRLLRFVVACIITYITLLVVTTLTNIVFVRIDGWLSANEKFAIHNSICNNKNIIVRTTASITNDLAQVYTFLTSGFILFLSGCYIWIRIEANYRKYVRKITRLRKELKN